jgi:hypothetical protein
MSESDCRHGWKQIVVDQAKRPEPQGDQRERDRRPAARHQALATAAFVRRLRRARHPAGRSGGPGLIPAGADVNAVQRERNAVNDGDGGLDARRVPRSIFAAHAVRPARPLPTGPESRQRRREDADGVTEPATARRVPLGIIDDVAFPGARPSCQESTPVPFFRVPLWLLVSERLTNSV